MFCTTHSFDNGARRRLACRTHVDCWSDSPRRRNQICRSRVSIGLRQDQHGDDDSISSWVESRDNRRRHRVDEIRVRRSAVCDQSRSRLLRSSARHRARNQPQCLSYSLRKLCIYQRRRNRRWRCLVGGTERRSPSSVD